MIGRTVVNPAGGYTATCSRCAWSSRYPVRLRSHALTALHVHTQERHA